MENQKVVVAILILAILFSVVATVMSLSILDFKPVFVEQRNTINTESSDAGGVSISIDPYQPAEVLE